MKKVIFLLLVVAGCTVQQKEVREKMSLAGEWGFKIDSLDQGIKDHWYSESFSETVKLPGSMAENGKGNEVTLNTDWTGDIVDKSYFTDSKYEKYRQPGNIKIPFWLKPVKYYKGAAWYQREIDIPAGWKDRRIFLSLERCHWQSSLFINDREAGTQNSLSTPHQYDITPLLQPGRNRITIRIDNRVIIPVGVNSHSISDHTQSNWNGITGEICLQSAPQVFIDEIRVFPEPGKKNARVVVTIKNPNKEEFSGKLLVSAMSPEGGKPLRSKIVTIVTKSDDQKIVVDYGIENPQSWSEFTPALYTLSADLMKGKELIDHQSTEFGMREFRTKGTRFTVNSREVFLRGTLECCIFPLTGYPPTDLKSWEKVLGVCKEYGLNTIRFHSWCPPEAAFVGADRLGLYFQIECASWANSTGSSIGDGLPVDRFIYEEGDRIIKAYGNHPSFCMLAYGNEPGGEHQNEYLGKLIKYWKTEDNRRVYTSGAGWPIIPENDYNLTAAPRIQGWGEGLKSIINAKPPQTMFDYRDFVSRYQVPTVSHEIGQWCAYPDFKEISKYTGVLKPTNFEIFRETLNENNMGGQAEDFLTASGKLQALCYKADIEAALRTPGFGGFHLLQLHDFPGQGTALVGILNPFFENKGYITPAEFRMFCNETVPLARMAKMVYSADETFGADIEIAHFGAEAMKKAEIVCSIINTAGDTLMREVFNKDTISIGNCIPVGTVAFNLNKVTKAEKLVLDVTVKNTQFRNRWDFWVYPEEEYINEGKVFITDKLDNSAQKVLSRGGSVLLLPYGKVGKTKGAQVAIGFSSIFWNTAWTNNQPPHTLGILCDPAHPVFRDFPTENHSNWQWWDPVAHSQAMILNGFPPDLKSLIQPIDTWFENRRLALAFEAGVSGGKLLVCSIDLKNLSPDRLSSRQLLISILNYMNSDAFNPKIRLTPWQVKGIFSD